MTATDTSDKTLPQATPPAEIPAQEPASALVHTIDIGGMVTDATTPERLRGEELPGTPLNDVTPDNPLPEATLEVVPGEPSALETTVEVAAKDSAADRATADATLIEKPAGQPGPVSILAIDIGGTKVKLLATGQTEARKAPSGRDFTPARLVETVREHAADWEFEAVTIGYPGLVGPHGPRSEPGNLGAGWVGFDFAAAFGKPVKMINDAAMQALGSYEGGRMLFLGLGTGLGSTLITGQLIVPLELGQMLYGGNRTLGQVLSRRGLARIGKCKWQEAVNKVVTALMRAFIADYVVIGGGNAKHVKELPPGARLGHNLTAFRGGFRLWAVEDVWVLAVPGGESPRPTVQGALRML